MWPQLFEPVDLAVPGQSEYQPRHATVGEERDQKFGQSGVEEFLARAKDRLEARLIGLVEQSGAMEVLGDHPGANADRPLGQDQERDHEQEADMGCDILEEPLSRSLPAARRQEHEDHERQPGDQGGDERPQGQPVGAAGKPGARQQAIEGTAGRQRERDLLHAFPPRQGRADVTTARAGARPRTVKPGIR